MSGWGGGGVIERAAPLTLGAHPLGILSWLEELAGVEALEQRSDLLTYRAQWPRRAWGVLCC